MVLYPRQGPLVQNELMTAEEGSRLERQVIVSRAKASRHEDERCSLSNAAEGACDGVDLIRDGLAARDPKAKGT